MAVVFEIYDKDGVLLLDNKSFILTLGLKMTLGTASLGKGNTSTWDNVGGNVDPQTSRYANNTSVNFINKKVAVGFDHDAWFVPITEGGVLYTLGVNSFAVKKDSDFNVAYMKDSIPNSSSKYLSLYDADGKLMWSVDSLKNAPIVLDKINISGRQNIAINLESYGVPVSELYLKTSYTGSVWYDEEGLGGYNSLGFKRVGNIVYATPCGMFKAYTVDKPYYIYVARIKG